MMGKLYLPALRGLFGSWTFYSCLIPFDELATRVDFATDLHKSKNLSDLIQRELKHGRAEAIEKYLTKQKERFFNSLVIAVYGGDPTWHQFDKIKPQRDDIRIDEISETAKNSIGFLSLSGKEKLFAIDGQHRLAGIKLVVEKHTFSTSDEASVIFVAHKKTRPGIIRTRRLFTTLNKTAKPVSKGEIIALDEDDLMAIIVRRLVNDSDMFKGNRIAYNQTNNLPSTNLESLTTIGNLYDVLTILFSKIKCRTSPNNLKYYRLEDQKIDEHYEYAILFFETMMHHFPILRRFFISGNYESLVKKNRGSFGGNVLFRPIGLTIMTEVVAEMVRERDLEASIKLAGQLPQDLTGKPYADVLWDTKRKIMINGGRSLTRRLLLYMLGEKVDKAKLTKDYGKALGLAVNEAVLPKQLLIKD